MSCLWLVFFVCFALFVLLLLGLLVGGSLLRENLFHRVQPMFVVLFGKRW